LNAQSGSGIWISEDHPLNRAIRVPGTHQSNQTGEIAAVVATLQAVDPTTPLKIISDSRYTIDGLTKHLKTWEDNGWTGIDNKPWFQAAAYQLRRRAAPTTFQWTKAHKGTRGNEQADQLAKQGANKEEPDLLDLTVPIEFQARRIKLSTLAQKIAYREIAYKQTPPYPRTTLMNLDITRYAIEELTGNLETDKTIWKQIRNPDIRRPIQQFLYRAITGSLRIGDFWSNIPNYEQRATCHLCENDIENLEHIILDCRSPERETIWNLMKQLWPTNEQHPTTIGLILGSGSISPKLTENNPPSAEERGLARLKRILLSESTHLIWVIRCERVIRGTRHTKQTIKSRWMNKITNRLDIDRRTTKSKRKTTLTNKVKNTWISIIQPTPHQDWVTNQEVLVGIK
ncbi:ribonuclease H-like protein, partial [Boletus edulis]